MQSVGISVGIDLGTTNTLVAIQEAGKPRIIPNELGEIFTPSVVSFSNEGFLVGHKALNNAKVAPRDTVFSVKRLMGRKINEEIIKTARKQYSYIITSDEETEDDRVKVLLNGTKYSPEAISSMILQQAIDSAEQSLNKKVTHAVITVPAYFTEPQREATLNAGKEAGLIVKKIIDEPTAAAIAFGVEHADETHQTLVFDMGGGTCDISIIYMSNRAFVGKYITGDLWLGGDDFNRIIQDMVFKHVKENYAYDPSDDMRFAMMAFREAERAKCILSKQDQADVIIPAGFELPGGEPVTVKTTIMRSEFENGIRRFVEKSVDLVREAMKSGDLEPENISTVLLVGGSTHIPLVRNELEKMFGKDKVRSSENPMEMVALGAAILAEGLHGIECIKCKHLNPYQSERCEECNEKMSADMDSGKIRLHEVTERNLGIGAIDKDDPDTFSVLIEAGKSYPLREPIRKQYRTTGRRITIPVYAGHSKKASENEYLGLVEFMLPGNVPARIPVSLYFNYDRNRILKVSLEADGYTECRYEMSPRRNLAAPLPEKDSQKRDQLRNLIKFMDQLIANYGDFIDPEQKRLLEEEKRQAMKIMTGKKSSDVEDSMYRLMQTVKSAGLASTLFLADRLMSEVDAETSRRLAETKKYLCDSYRKRDETRLAELQSNIDSQITSILKNTPINPEIKGYDGLLEIISAPTQPS